MERTPLTDHLRPVDEVVSLVRGARFVVLGESTHGTHETYVNRVTIRARCSRSTRRCDDAGFPSCAFCAGYAHIPR